MRSEPLTVTELTQHVARLLRNDDLLSGCTVRGELSNYRTYASGHHYFTLKDAGAELSCVMFRGDAQRLRFEPGDGQRVRAAGRVDVYEKRGQYQMYVSSLQHDGLGALYEAYELLRARLAEEGLFDEARKRPLPSYPERVAVITSPDGAAVRDMLRVLRQRWPGVRITLVPATVQGETAAASLVQGLRLANAVGDVDVILIGRGGGSIEDLWAFNEEPVARAIAASRVPVIAAVGHESDVTIADFVADLRAATPTHAAELAVPEREAVQRHVRQLGGRLAAGLRQRAAVARMRFEAAARRRCLAEPGWLFEQRAQRLDELSVGLSRALVQRVAMGTGRLERAAAKLEALNPEAVLGRGYAILTRADDGRVVRTPDQVSSGESAQVRLAGGTLMVTVD